MKTLTSHPAHFIERSALLRPAHLSSPHTPKSLRHALDTFSPYYNPPPPAGSPIHIHFRTSRSESRRLETKASNPFVIPSYAKLPEAIYALSRFLEIALRLPNISRPYLYRYCTICSRFELVFIALVSL